MMKLLIKRGKYLLAGGFLTSTVYKRSFSSILVLNPKSLLRFFFILLIFFSFSCDKNQNSVIPYVPVSFTINLNIVNDLNVPGNSVFFPGAGYGGIIIYCEVPGSYYAFDATCTYEISQTCRVVNDGVLGTCPCCESQFILISGAYPSKGPAAIPLKQYNVSVMNEFTLRVYN